MRLLGQAERARREQDLHHDRGVVAHLPHADRDGQRDQQPVCRATKRTPACRSRQKCAVGARRAHLVHLRCRAGSAPTRAAPNASTSSASGAPDQLDQRAGQAGPGDLGARAGERVLRMRLDQPLARDDLRQHDLRGAAGGGVDGADRRSRRRTATASSASPATRRTARWPRSRRATSRRRRRPAACARGRASTPQGSENSTKGTISIAVSRPICVGSRAAAPPRSAAARASSPGRRAS